MYIYIYTYYIHVYACVTYHSKQLHEPMHVSKSINECINVLVSQGEDGRAVASSLPPRWEGLREVSNNSNTNNNNIHRNSNNSHNSSSNNRDQRLGAPRDKALALSPPPRCLQTDQTAPAAYYDIIIIILIIIIIIIFMNVIIIIIVIIDMIIIWLRLRFKAPESGSASPLQTE